MKSIVKDLYKVFQAVVKKLNNALPNLVELGPELSHFISEPRKLAEVIILPADSKKVWLKENLKYIKNLINN